MVINNILREVECQKCGYKWVTRSVNTWICCSKCHRKSKVVEPRYCLKVSNRMIYDKLLEMRKETEDEHRRLAKLLKTKRA